MRRSRLLILGVCGLLPLLALAATAAERFPPPDFTDHALPTITTPPPRAELFEYLDLAALAVGLALASYFAIVKRSRRGLFVLTIASLAWLGFWREGCICPIGAIQNVTLALFDSHYAIPWTVAAVFALPLLFTLFFGRTFCAAVCPLGAVQELVALRPVNVPAWLDQALGLLAYVYLGAGVIFAATGAAFVICRYDPFVGFFRRSASSEHADSRRVFSGRRHFRRPALLPIPVPLRRDSRAAVEGVEVAREDSARPVHPVPALRRRLSLRRDPRAYHSRRRPRSGGAAGAAWPCCLRRVPCWSSPASGWAGSWKRRWPGCIRWFGRPSGFAWSKPARSQGTTDASDAFRNTGRPAADLYAEAIRLRGMFRAGRRMVRRVGRVGDRRQIDLSLGSAAADRLSARSGRVRLVRTLFLVLPLRTSMQGWEKDGRGRR